MGDGVPLPSRLQSLGKRRELAPRGVRVGDPDKNMFGAFLSCQKATGVNHFNHYDAHFFTLQSSKLAEINQNAKDLK